MVSRHHRGRGGIPKDEKFGFILKPAGVDPERRVNRIPAWGLYSAVKITQNYYVAGIHVILCDCTSQNVLVFLRAAARGRSRSYTIKKIDEGGNGVVVYPNEGELIDGQENYELLVPYTSITVFSDGDNWWIL